MEEEGRNWWFTRVYGTQDDNEKLLFLQELRDVRALCPGPWLLAGDFNLIHQAEDKNNQIWTGLWWGGCFDASLMIARSKNCWWDRSLLGPMRGTIQCWCDWTRLFAVQNGNTVLQSVASGVSDHFSLLLCFKVCSVLRANVVFTSRVFGWSCLVLLMQWNRTRKPQCPLPVLLNVFFLNSSGLVEGFQKERSGWEKKIEDALSGVHLPRAHDRKKAL